MQPTEEQLAALPHLSGHRIADQQAAGFIWQYMLRKSVELGKEAVALGHELEMESKAEASGSVVEEYSHDGFKIVTVHKHPTGQAVVNPTSEFKSYVRGRDAVRSDRV